jgi:multisubunit Na+/H+ antiporter MnhE subunit
MPALRILLWFLSLYALWWWLVGTWSPWNAVWGAALACLGSVAALVTGGPARRRTPSSRWPQELGRAVLQVPLDFALLVAVLSRTVVQGDRGPHGSFLARSTRETGSRAASRRAWVTILATLSPNAYVVDLDADSGRALVHDLRPWRSSEEPA